LIHENDSAALAEFGKMRKNNFSNDFLKQATINREQMSRGLQKEPLDNPAAQQKGTAAGIYQHSITVKLTGTTPVNCIILREDILRGQTVDRFKIILYNRDQPVREINGTTIGRKRILTFPVAKITSFKVFLDSRNGRDAVSGVEAYHIDDKLLER
jgi:alpha-L-fucosidase